MRINDWTKNLFNLTQTRHFFIVSLPSSAVNLSSTAQGIAIFPFGASSLHIRIEFEPIMEFLYFRVWKGGPGQRVWWYRCYFIRIKNIEKFDDDLKKISGRKNFKNFRPIRKLEKKSRDGYKINFIGKNLFHLVQNWSRKKTSWGLKTILSALNYVF